MKTLFLLAGASGSGKTTLLRKSYLNSLRIFGEKYHELFLLTNQDRSGKEYKKYEVAKGKHSYFKSYHIPRLRLEESLPSCVLIHIDITFVLRKLVITHSEKMDPCLLKGNPLFSARRREEDILNKKKNDVLLRNYFNDSFFGRFDSVVVNTLFCEFRRNCRQIMKRSDEIMALDPDIRAAKKVHSECYNCWQRNLDVLSTSHCFSSRVVGRDTLLVDGSPVTKSYSEMR